MLYTDIHIYNCTVTLVIGNGTVLCRASSIPEFAVCCGKKMRNCPFFATFISNSRFFGLVFNFTDNKTIKSSRCKLTFMIIMSINGLM